jgi:hypothetical protein
MWARFAEDLGVGAVFHHDFEFEALVFHAPIVSGGWGRWKRGGGRSQDSTSLR